MLRREAVAEAQQQAAECAEAGQQAEHERDPDQRLPPRGELAEQWRVGEHGLLEEGLVPREGILGRLPRDDLRHHGQPALLHLDERQHAAEQHELELGPERLEEIESHDDAEHGEALGGVKRGRRIMGVLAIQHPAISASAANDASQCSPM